MHRAPLTFLKDGTEHLPGAATAWLSDLELAFAGLPKDQAGIRIHGLPALRRLLTENGPFGRIATRILGQCQSVRAVLFDKTPSTNWSLGWHQDRTICVKDRVDVQGYGPWTIKHGLLHVAPPFELLSRMLTMRIHLDDVAGDNAPLIVAPGSHTRQALIGEVEDVVRTCGTHVCLAAAGDVWLYSTPILHASEAAGAPGRRRVLQIDFSADSLPDGLEWLGV